jgi:hypothetical protein
MEKWQKKSKNGKKIAKGCKITTKDQFKLLQIEICQ